MNAEAFDGDAYLPPVMLPAALIAATAPAAPVLTKGNQPGEIVILIEADTYSSAS